MERTYVIPLRREFRKVPKYKRAKKATRALKEFLAKHMKPAPDTEPKLGKYLNLEVWKHGIRNPPCKVKVIATKDDKGQVWAELFGAPVDKKEETKEEKKKDAKEAKKVADKKESSPAQNDSTTATDAKKEPAKAQPEIKEAKIVTPKQTTVAKEPTKTQEAKPAAEKKPSTKKTLNPAETK
ncbi:MAG: 50S ribosomal protein L31e [Candidatus Woesearchaeota archaeon]|nr:50S ribosomal protein L31e [Candidatus Woesearchaeota archaeon]